MLKQLPLLRLSAKWSVRSHTIDLDKLLAVYCAATRSLIKKSNILHPVAGSAVFTTKTFGQGTIVRYHYQSLVYEDLYRRQQMAKTYREPILAVMRYMFKNWVNKLPETTIARN